MAHGPACEARSSSAQGANRPACPAGTEMPPMDHWSIGRPQGAPLGLQTSASLVVATRDEACGRVTPIPGKVGADTPGKVGADTPGAVTGSVPPAPPAGGAERVSVLPSPKYKRVGFAPVNGYVDVSSNRPLPRS